MKATAYDYNLPKEQIAQLPLELRAACKLMVLRKDAQTIEHSRFDNIKNYLKPGDLLVINNTKVVPAKLLLYRDKALGKIDALLVSKETGGKELWRVILSKRKGMEPGTILLTEKKELTALIKSLIDDEFLIEFTDTTGESLSESIKEIGFAPLPPYIKRKDKNTEKAFKNKDKIDYQTVFARFDGSIAAPTAGMHFTPDLMQELKQFGVEFVEITHHIGKGTFKPIKTDEIENHHMDKEYFEIDADSADRINKAKLAGRRVITVGTSSTRAIETSCIDPKQGLIAPGKAWTGLFITDGYKYKVIDAIITNFHLPKSTNLVMTCVFGGKEYILKAYNEAVAQNYRFYSYGDAMFLS
ncbi:MAG: tRNA preQ1(34) S-adenosylmethionine ribosyltransferase-isomerase QueA [Candidatus Firestonebacteria bacterium RIFOXYC2_FULL_39_67]|nr:MAG: tRNA preQ1(34) S-adenosylmethionine ribosyltransferase-isomerase QueA [Candidatus Firestonebacteria bacterium RIFOXYD2_FULL_39_29]OGF53111.1 MAG: tRNA preQ1(34) S-adenosylmethionine ribosyltransferase-isomerase QueA [Candidatus Firestonebacteria bacterium RifOxyC12_full_39_7]OGF54113.1 MAG: tRNA preQ1(34) S-adenosylmethionine ribosyltransferase-isomerase QueA [Candidatus Firestonebacteria bacterium RIFOXYC2_FULL_39_67]